MTLSGKRIDRYEVGELLGQGGFGAVYRARHAVVGTECALKVLWPDHAQDPVQVERFLREARAAAAIGHPNIVRVIDAGQTPDGTAFLAMERLAGETLEDRVARGPLSVAEAVGVVGDVLDALGAAHAAGIVHRDLKPGNVFLTRDGEVKLLDFGISKIGGETKLTHTGMVLGTPQFMAPEQLAGKPVDGRADLYAAATMLYELLAGDVPFPGSGYDVIVRRVQGAKAPPLLDAAPDVPVALARTIERGLAFDRDARFGDAAIFKRALESALRGAGPELDVVTEPPRPSPLHGVALATAVGPEAMPASPWVGESTTQSTTPSPLHGVPARGSSPSMPSATRSTPPPDTPDTGPTLAAAPAKDAKGPWMVLAVAGLAVLLAGGLGVFGVLLYRLQSQPPGPTTEPAVEPVAPTPETPEPVAPTPEVTEPEGTQPEGTEPEGTEPEGIEPQPEPVTPEPVGAAPAPSAVRYDVFLYTGTGQRAAFDVVLENARPAVARCAVEGQPMHVSVQIVATLSGAITVAQPHPVEPSDDDAVARCVASAIQAAGPARFNAVQSAVANIHVDVPAR